MADFISREAAIEAIWKPEVRPNDLIFDALRRACEEEVKHIPAADVVEVVRCRDCDTYNRGGCPDGYGVCMAPEVYGAVLPEDFFCKYGRRADNG